MNNFPVHAAHIHIYNLKVGAIFETVATRAYTSVRYVSDTQNPLDHFNHTKMLKE
jgi:hypothetical protein